MSDQSISGSETDQYRTSDLSLLNCVYAAGRINSELSYKVKYPHHTGPDEYIEGKLREDVLTICRHFNIGECVLPVKIVEKFEPKLFPGDKYRATPEANKTHPQAHLDEAFRHLVALESISAHGGVTDGVASRIAHLAAALRNFSAIRENVEPKESVAEESKFPVWTLGPDDNVIEAQRWLERAAQIVDRKIARELNCNRRVHLRPDRLPPWLSSLKTSLHFAAQAVSKQRSKQEYAQNETRTLNVLRKAREIIDGRIARHPDAEPQDVHTVQAGTLIIEPGHTYEFTVGAGEVYLCAGRMRNGRVALEVSDAPQQGALPGPLTYEEYQSNSNPRVLITFKTDEDALKWVASLAQVIATKK